MEEVEVLVDDLPILATENDPTKTCGSKTKFVARCIDRHHAGDSEVPHKIWVHERGKESGGRGVHMDRDKMTGLVLVFLQNIIDFLNTFEASCVRGTQNNKNADRVFVQVASDQFVIEQKVCVGHGNYPFLDVKIPGKFFQGYLAAGCHEDVWMVVILSCCFAFGLPVFFHGKSSQHDGLG
ncbi:hypothetical protein OGATHE_004501 [Ogataea polymorpha]|uniref:Uncharacterized protein n=1 Tax=Ogataea polymorpha TaxID=460523 RepID=A0A9P8P066_9ASCO|nr:hypothetical protein OGATHE_004501 [Ogataea polymorpha]